MADQVYTGPGVLIRLAILNGTLMDIDGPTGPNQLYNRGTTPWTLIGTLGTDYAIPDIVTFTNLALIANGYETPWSYDGTTLQHLTDGPGTGSLPAGAGHHAVHQGFYWLWNTAAISDTYDGPSSLRSSDLDNPNSWPKANQIFIDKDDGDIGMGLGQFTIAEAGISPTTSQIVFKTFASYQMTGVFGSTNPAFAIQKIKTDMGCVAARSIRFAPGFGLLRLTHRGVAQFNGVDDLLISEEIRPLLFGDDTYSGIEWQNVSGVRAAVTANPPYYLLACPLSGRALTRIFAYDLVRRSWVVLDYSEPIAAIEAINTQSLMPQVLIGDYAAGHVREIFAPKAEDDGADDGVRINCQAQLKPVFGSSPQQNAYFHYAILKMFDVIDPDFTVGWSVVAGPITGPAARSISGTKVLPAEIPTTTDAGLGYGEEPWGDSPYGSVLPSTEMDVTLPMGFIADNAYLILSWTGKATIRGIEWHIKPKPLNRPSTYV